MFEKLKQIKDLRSQAKTMQSALATEIITVEKTGVKLTINGNMEITKLELDPEIGKDKLQDNTKEAFNDSIKKIQKIMAQKMQQMGGLGNLGDLLK